MREGQRGEGGGRWEFGLNVKMGRDPGGEKLASISISKY